MKSVQIIDEIYHVMLTVNNIFHNVAAMKIFFHVFNALKNTLRSQGIGKY